MKWSYICGLIFGLIILVGAVKGIMEAEKSQKNNKGGNMVVEYKKVDSEKCLTIEELNLEGQDGWVMIKEETQRSTSGLGISRIIGVRTLFYRILLPVEWLED